MTFDHVPVSKVAQALVRHPNLPGSRRDVACQQTSVSQMSAHMRTTFGALTIGSSWETRVDGSMGSIMIVLRTRDA